MLGSEKASRRRDAYQIATPCWPRSCYPAPAPLRRGQFQKAPRRRLDRGHCRRRRYRCLITPKRHRDADQDRDVRVRLTFATGCPGLEGGIATPIRSRRRHRTKMSVEDRSREGTATPTRSRRVRASFDQRSLKNSRRHRDADEIATPAGRADRSRGLEGTATPMRSRHRTGDPEGDRFDGLEEAPRRRSRSRPH
jgi:hypothetical protein